jgi:hypothetical protein
MTLTQRYGACVVVVCWLRLDVVPLSVVLCALGYLRLLSILTTHSVCYPPPLSIVTASCDMSSGKLR